MNMIRKSGSTCRLTFDTAESSGLIAGVRADVKVVSGVGRAGGLIEHDAGRRGCVLHRRNRVICCLMTLYRGSSINSNQEFTLQILL
jgi:hypothetical protein